MSQLSIFSSSPPEQLKLSEGDIQELHTRLMEVSLHGLDDKRAGDGTKEDVLSWVNEGGIRPFSFDACCIFAGVDPEKTREAIEHLVRRVEER